MNKLTSLIICSLLLCCLSPISSNASNQGLPGIVDGPESITDDAKWGDFVEVSSPTDNGDDKDVDFIEFQDLLYMAWDSEDDTITNGTDRDIVLRTYDGLNFGPIVELSTIGDTGQDFLPQLEVFNDKLYVVWETRDPITSDGTDMDIVYRSFDGTIWSPIEEITPVGDASSDYIPQVEVFDDRLWVVWRTDNPSLGWSTDADIVLRSFDGSAWGSYEEVTPTTNFGTDLGPCLSAYNGQLYVAWATNDAVTSSGGDWDIVVRSRTSTAWNPVVEITNITDSGDDGNDPIDMATYQGKLVVAWGTDDSTTSDGGDYDVVMREFDGTSWAPIVEVTNPGDSSGDNIPHLQEYNDKLFITWIWGDYIGIKSYDGATFSSQANPFYTPELLSMPYPDVYPYKTKLYFGFHTENTTITTGSDLDIVITDYDDVPPNIELVSPENNSFIQPGVILDLNITDVNLNFSNYSIDGQAPVAFAPPFDIDTTGWIDGMYNITVNAIDNASNSALSYLTFTIDNESPITNLSIGNPVYYESENSTWVNLSTQFTLNSSDGNGSGVNHTWIRAWQNGWTNWTEYNGSFDMTIFDNELGELPSGRYYLEYFSTDILGRNESVNNQSLFIDFSPPTAYLNPDSYYYTGGYNLTINATDDGCGVDRIYYSYWKEGLIMPWQQFMYFIPIAGDEGLHYIEFYAIDNLGQASDIQNVSIYFEMNSPYVYWQSPSNGSSNVNLTPTIIFRFNEPIRNTSFSSDNIITNIGAEYIYGFNGTNLTIKILEDLSQNTSYYISLEGNITDIPGNILRQGPGRKNTLTFTTWIDFDNDGVPDQNDPDDDNDSFPDTEDIFPLDPLEWADFDGDNIGDNADPDDDNDGVNDDLDAFPYNPSEHGDADGDGIGDNADPDDDNDGILDVDEGNPPPPPPEEYEKNYPLLILLLGVILAMLLFMMFSKP